MLNKLTDHALVAKTDSLVQEERAILTNLLHHFREIERRRLYSDFGYKSLYDMLTKKFGYSEDQAYRRIAAMRLLKEIPEIETQINEGLLNLTHLGLAQNLFRQEKKIHQIEISREEKLQVLTAFANKTTREAEKIAFSFSSRPEELKEDRIQSISESKIELRFLASADLQRKIETLKGWRAHRDPKMSLGELFEQLCDLALLEWAPGKSAAPRKHGVTRSTSRTIARVKVSRDQKPSAAAIRRSIFSQAENKCEKCGSEYALEIDHIQPRAFGGESTTQNLRLLCRSCNQRAAIVNLGQKKMDRYLS